MSGVRVVLTGIGVREPWWIAAGLTARGIPFQLLTSTFVPENAKLTRACRRVARATGPGPLDLVRRRCDPAIDACSVRDWLFPDILGRTLRVFRAPVGLSYTLVNSLFDRAAARALPSEAEVVVVMQGAALETVRQAHVNGSLAVVIANSPDARREIELVAREERRLGLSSGAADRWQLRLADRIARELSEADLVIANSRFSRDDLIASGLREQKIVAIPLGVDTELFAPPAERRHRPNGTVVYTGSVQPRKGVIHLAEAVEILRSEGLECRAVAYGVVERRYGRLLRPFIRSGTLELAGGVSRARLPELLRAGDLFCYPTLSDGFGLSVYEAMACGLPVVVSDRCGARVEDGVTGLVVPHGDSPALAAALQLLLLEPAYAARLGDAGVAVARKASTDTYCHAVISELSRLTGSDLRAAASAAQQEVAVA